MINQSRVKYFTEIRESKCVLFAIVLQTNSPTKFINNSTFQVDSLTKPIIVDFTSANCWSYTTAGLFKVVKSSVSLILLFVGLLIVWKRAMCHLLFVGLSIHLPRAVLLVVLLFVRPLIHY